MIKGLHVCKPTNAPQVGQVKTFVVNGDRIKSKAADQGGQSYVIKSVTQSETYKDSYGNLGFTLEIEPQNGAQSTQADRGSAGTFNGRDDTGNRIERQHSQEMALRYMTLRFPTGIPEGTDGTSMVRDLTNWFQRDISRSPEKQQTTPEPEYQPDTTPDDDQF